VVSQVLEAIKKTKDNNLPFFINDLLNGTHDWFFETLSEVLNKEKSHVKDTLVPSIREYADRSFSLKRNLGLTERTYSFSFIREDEELATGIINFILNTYCTTQTALPVVVVLLIAIHRAEDDYRKYLASIETHDHTFALTVFYFNHFQNKSQFQGGS
jgi:hypothetical protein